jgi:hypothetical protein
VGFTLTGTHTLYRRRIVRDLIRKFARIGWLAPIYKHLPFERAAVASIGDDAIASDSEPDLAEYHANFPELLFNINPPQSAKWPYSSPMRILRAVLLGQIPVITKKFHDHPLEDVAMEWDGKVETAVDLGARQFLDRRLWLTDYMRSIEAYDRLARATNKPFVSAVKALTELRGSSAPASATETTAFSTRNRVSERR